MLWRAGHAATAMFDAKGHQPNREWQNVEKRLTPWVFSHSPFDRIVKMINALTVPTRICP